MKKYYHLTNVENIDSIKEKGLLANDNGNIYLFENKFITELGWGTTPDGRSGFGKVQQLLADHIAASQLCLKEYAVFEVNGKGITAELEHDYDDGTWVVRQEVISPNHIRLVRTDKTMTPELIECLVEADAS